MWNVKRSRPHIKKTAEDPHKRFHWNGAQNRNAHAIGLDSAKGEFEAKLRVPMAVIEVVAKGAR